MGFINGYFVMKLRITPVIATLVTLSLYKGIALLIVPEGLSSIKGSADKVMPAWINDYARKDVLFGLPWAFWVAVLVIAVLFIVRKTISASMPRR
jgi:ribose/xylose/arabinose/galactoside ABC-type transport system permease subunit